jgi:hypothetical protein
MTLGPGNYDKELTQARVASGATSAILIVLRGIRGEGFCCQTTYDDLLRLPEVLRAIADEMESDRKRMHAAISYTCPACKRTSYSPHDIEHRYCGHCHRFEDGRRRVP